MRIIRSLGTFRYLCAAFFMSAVFYATYRQRPLLADPICENYSGGKRVRWSGPNEGCFATKASCETFWTEANPSNACEEICGSQYKNGTGTDQCSQEFCDDWEWSWYAGVLNCKLKTEN
jgi:hypothetical protein